jgi:predicted RNA-binding protein
MCESNVYVLEEGGKKLVMKDAAKILFEDNKIKIHGIIGNTVEADDCEIDVIDLMKHEIILKKKRIKP